MQYRSRMHIETTNVIFHFNYSLKLFANMINLSPANWTLAWFRPLLMLPPQNAWSTESMAAVSPYRTIWRLQADGTRISSSTSRKH